MVVQQPMTELLARLPAAFLRAAARGSGSLPMRQPLSGSCLWLDVSKFTALSERLSQHGPTGIETLSGALDDLYGCVASSVAATGGDVLFFAGDGALCLWEAAQAGDARASARAALAAALCIREEIGTHRRSEVRIDLRQVVVTGEFAIDTVGGEEALWIDVLTGSPLTPLSTLEKNCPAGRIVLSAPTVELLGGEIRTTAIAGDAALLEDANLGSSLPGPAGRFDITSLSAEKLATRLPAFVARQLAADAVSPAELRRVSVAFVHCGQELGLVELDRLAKTIQHASVEHAGRLCQLMQDDKGLVSLVAFGLPGNAQGEDAARAVSFARRTFERLRALGLDVRVGLATGSVFCGVCGNAERRQYCVFGTTVIRAARLAEQAVAEPLVDEETSAQAIRKQTFVEHGVMSLKGLARPLRAYRVGSARRDMAAPSELIGRETERERLRAALSSFARGEGDRLVVIEGDLGSGKTALLSAIPTLASESSLDVSIGATDRVERHTGYFALRSVMRHWFGRPDDEIGAASLGRDIAAVGEDPDLAPLLNALLLTDLKTTPLVQQMAPEVRAENRQRLVGKLVERKVSERRCVVIIDDAHWIDASSLELIAYLREHLHGVLWVVAERSSLGDEAPPPSSLGGATVLSLGPLDSDGVRALVALHAGSRVSERVSDAAVRAGRGNPLHSIELVRAVLASGHVELKNGVIDIDESASHRLLDVPPTLEELIQSRFDRLSSGARKVVRAASVIGDPFEHALLRSVVDPELSVDERQTALTEVLEQGILQERNDTLEFEHGAVRSVVYSLLLPSVQQTLHQRTALALQSLFVGNRSAVAVRLAHHWLSAKNSEKAAEFSALAAQQALEGYANADAVHWFTRALEQDLRFRGPLDVDVKRAKWALAQAQGFYSMSRHAEAREAYGSAIRWTGFRVPRTAAELPLAVAGVALSSAWHKLTRTRARQVDGELRERYLAAMRVIHSWATLDIWEGRLTEAANKAFVAYRLAQHADATPEAAEAISGLGYLLAVTPGRAFSEQTLVRAVNLADDRDDLQAQTSSRVLLGMYLTMVGRTERARAPLEAAAELANRLGSGLWRHRAAFGLGEALLSAGELSQARDAFTKAARLAADAEPPVEGFANCLAALAAARSGNHDEATRIVEGERGVRLVSGNCLLLQRFVALGVQSETLLQNGDPSRALAVADQALRLSERARDVNVFFAGLHGHAGVAEVFLSCLERDRASSTWDRNQLFERSKVSVSQLRAFAQMYPAARPRAEISLGRYHALRARPRRAAASFRRAEALARASNQPYDVLLATDRLRVLGREVRS